MALDDNDKRRIAYSVMAALEPVPTVEREIAKGLDIAFERLADQLKDLS